jgi:hypothetical protein
VGVNAMEESIAREAIVPNCEVKKASKVILDTMHNSLSLFSNVAYRQNVMKKVMMDPFTGTNILKKMRFSRDAVVNEDILSFVRQFLSVLRCPRASAELAKKHAILTALISSDETTFVRHYARVLKVHPRNISKAVLRRKRMDLKPKI